MARRPDAGRSTSGFKACRWRVRWSSSCCSEKVAPVARSRVLWASRRGAISYISWPREGATTAPPTAQLPGPWSRDRRLDSIGGGGEGFLWARSPGVHERRWTMPGSEIEVGKTSAGEAGRLRSSLRRSANRRFVKRRNIPAQPGAGCANRYLFRGGNDSLPVMEVIPGRSWRCCGNRAGRGTKISVHPQKETRVAGPRQPFTRTIRLMHQSVAAHVA